ncbi:MAG: MFS transporter [Acidobacteriota bacterium]
MPVAGQLVQALGGGPVHVVALRAAGSFGLLLSLAYVSFGRGRSPLEMLFWPELLSRTLMVAIGLLGGLTGLASPATLFAVVLFAAHASAGLPVSYVSTLYGLVYPDEHRARIVAVTRMVNGMVGIAAAFFIGRLLQGRPEDYLLVYPLYGAFAILVSLHYRKMPTPKARQAESPDAPSAWQVLKTDRAFRGFQFFQFLLGLANLAAIPVIDVHVRKGLGLPIGLAVVVVNQGVIGMSATLLTVRYQARLFDRLGVLRHRVLTSLFLGAALLVWAFTDSLAGAAFAALLTGLGMAGGQIIWLIGSLSFAPKEQLSTYMGIHTFLTGLRGVAAPYLGLWLMEQPFLAWDQRKFFIGAATLVFLSAWGHAWVARSSPPSSTTTS